MINNIEENEGETWRRWNCKLEKSFIREERRRDVGDNFGKVLGGIGHLNLGLIVTVRVDNITMKITNEMWQ